MSRCDVAVVGLGVMGSAAAWQLAGRGRSVIGVEQHAPDHVLGSSHGASRIFRLAYEQDDYVRLAVEALPLWRQLEEESSRPILTQTGAIDYGTPAVLERIADALRRNGLRGEWLEADEAQRRWPGFAFEGPVLYSPHGGRTDADAARAALQDAAANRGADLRFETRALNITPLEGGGVVVATGSDEIEAHAVVVTVNAWAATMLGSLVDLPAISVTQEQPAFFAPLDPNAEWPSFIQYAGDGTSASDFACYGLSSPDENGVKVGEHGTGIPIDPGGERPPVDGPRLERLSRYVSEHLPGLNPEPIGATRCLYATTPTEDFVLDRVGSVVVGVGFSGHGFKFAPAVGRVLADLADGGLAPAPRWSLPMASGRSWLPPT